MINTAMKPEQNPVLLAIIDKTIKTIFGEELKEWDIFELVDEDMSAHLTLKHKPSVKNLKRYEDEEWEDYTLLKADISVSLSITDNQTIIFITIMAAGNDAIHIMNFYEGLLKPEDIKIKAEDKLNTFLKMLGHTHFSI